MKKILLALLTVFLFSALYSQEVKSDTEVGVTEEFYTEKTIVSANKINYLHPDYPATPGDVYNIVYILPTVNTSNTIAGFVDNNYDIDLSFIGKLNVKGLIYTEVQDALKQKMTKAYPGSIVNVIINATGFFNVTLLGEVTQTRVLDAMSLTTLEHIISGKTTHYSSYRDVEIKSEDGSVAVYDLFKFRRYADKKENPYLKPNDIITIKPYKHTVTITGQIKKPGKYQLVEGDNLQDVIDIYANGFTKTADISRIILKRKLNNNDDVELETIIIDTETSDLSSYILRDYDNIIIPSVFTETKSVQLTGQAKKTGTFTIIDGDTLYDLIHIYGYGFDKFADISRISITSQIDESGSAIIERENSIINAETDDLKTIYLSDLDRVTIPRLLIETKNVTLNGYVKKQGSFTLSDGDTLYDLIHVYGYGYGKFADTSRITISSYLDEAEDVDNEKSVYNAEIDDLKLVILNDLDTVYIPRIRLETKSVVISGQIKSPGTYRLAEGDTLDDLINLYGYGFTKLAESSKIEIQRRIGKDDTYLESTLYIDYEKDDFKTIELYDFDRVYIPSKITFSPTVTFQGAITSNDAIVAEREINTIGSSVSNRISVPIIAGNKLSTAIRHLGGSFNLSSDLENSFILRGSEKIEVNIKDILSSADSSSDIIIEDKDIVIIPFRQLKVFVGGSVNSGGAVPFIENRTAGYYIGLAGGFDRTENLFKGYSISDVFGNKVDKDAIIGPEDVIWVNRDHPMSYVDEYGGWMTTIVSTIIISYQLTNLAATLK